MSNIKERTQNELTKAKGRGNTPQSNGRQQMTQGRGAPQQQTNKTYLIQNVMYYLHFFFLNYCNNSLPPSSGRGRGTSQNIPIANPTQRASDQPISSNTKPVQQAGSPVISNLPTQTSTQTPNTISNMSSSPISPVVPVPSKPTVPTPAASTSTATAHSTPQNPTFSHIPPRTHSAPPNLQEQERSTPVFLPEKSTATTTQLKVSATPYYPPTHISGGLPNYIPSQPMHYPQMPQAPIPTIMQPKKKAIPIIDPETGQEVVNTSVRPSTVAAPPAPQVPIAMPMGGFVSYGVPYPQMGYSQKFGPPKYFTAPGFPGLFPEIPPPQPPVMPSTVKPVIPEQQQQTDKSPTKSADLSPKSQRKFSQTKASPRQEFRVKSPGPPGTGNSQPILLTPKPDEKRPETTTPNETPDHMEPQSTSVTTEPVVQQTSTATVQPTPPTPTVKEEPPVTQDISQPTPIELKPTEPLEIKPEPPKELPNVEDKKEIREPVSVPAVTPTIVPDSLADSQGKKNLVYDRDFLLQFQPICMDRPVDLQKVEGIDDEMFKEARRGASLQGRGGFKDSRPPRLGPDGTPLRSAPPGFGSRGGMSNMRGPMSPGSRRQPGKKLMRTASSEGAALAPTPGRWEPQRNKRDSEAIESLLSKVKGILNKITEDTFQKLSDKIVTIGIDSIEVLTGIIKLIFDKALTEPKFCAMYVDLCRKLAENSPTFEVDGKPQSFKRLLLNRCQEEFEASFSANKKHVPKGEELSSEERLKMEEGEFITKKRMLGNITFIGGLYNIKMLPEKIMHECITKLLGDLKNPSHEDMEALCRLMTTIGRLLDHPKAKDYMDTYFARMKELARNKTLPSRIRFMLQVRHTRWYDSYTYIKDVITLRQNYWTSKKEHKPTTTTADKSHRGAPTAIQTRPASERNRPVSSQPYGRGSTHSNETEWETVGQRGKQPRSVTAPSQAPQQQQQQQQQKFHEEEEVTEEVKLRPQTYYGPMSGLGAKGWQSNKEDNKGQRDTKSSSKSLDKKESSSSLSAPKKNEMTIEELEKKVDSLLEKYFSGELSVEEVVPHIKELNVTTWYQEIVNRCIYIGLEKKDREREQISTLFSLLQEEAVLTVEHYVQGFMSVIDMLGDLSIDIPKSPIYLANFIGFAISDNYLPITFLEHAFDNIQESSSNKNMHPMRLGAEVFRTIAKTSSHKNLRELYHTAKMDITKFFPPKSNGSEWTKFVEEEKLSGLFPDLTYLKTLEAMINEDKESDKIVFYIERSVPKDETMDQDFCNAVLQMIFKHLCSSSNQDGILSNVGPVLCHLLGGSERKSVLQVGALYELQRLYHTTPSQKSNVEKLCHFLHECGAISTQNYNQWMVDKGNTSPGKEGLMLLLSKWISTLPPDQEEEDEDDDEDRFPFADEEEEEERVPTFDDEEDPY